MSPSYYVLDVRRYALEKGIRVQGYISRQGLQPFDLRLSEPLMRMPSRTNRQPVYHRLNNLRVGIRWTKENSAIVFYMSAEARHRVEDWIRWADEKAYDEMMRTGTGNIWAMTNLFERTGKKKPVYGSTQCSYADTFTFISDYAVMLRTAHYSGEILEICSINEEDADFEALYDISGYEYKSLEYWMDSEEGAADGIEGYEFEFVLDGGFGLSKYVKSLKTGCSLWVNRYSQI